jgi:hypothetical protein
MEVLLTCPCEFNSIHIQGDQEFFSASGFEFIEGPRKARMAVSAESLLFSQDEMK